MVLIIGSRNPPWPEICSIFQDRCPDVLYLRTVPPPPAEFIRLLQARGGLCKVLPGLDIEQLRDVLGARIAVIRRFLFISDLAFSLSHMYARKINGSHGPVVQMKVFQQDTRPGRALPRVFHLRIDLLTFGTMKVHVLTSVATEFRRLLAATPLLLGPFGPTRSSRFNFGVRLASAL